MGRGAETPIPYQKEAHGPYVYKFLYWAQGLSGTPLVQAGDNSYNHVDLADRAKQGGVVAHRKKPDGSGIRLLGLDLKPPEVYLWVSATFNATAPEELRLIILEALGLSEG